MSRPVLLLALFALLGGLGCPGPLDNFGDHGPSHGPSYNHSINFYSWNGFPDAPGASGLWATQVGSFRYALVGTDKGLRIQSLAATGVYVDMAGPAIHSGSSLQRDVETYNAFAYVCSDATGLNQGIMIIDISGLPAQPPVVGIFQPNDGDPRGKNLSLDRERGLLYLQRALGIEVWDIKTDPLHPAFLARFASDVPVSDLVSQGTRLYVAEGQAKGFSIWDMTSPTSPIRLSRWSSPGFANSIWPREDGQVVATVEETPASPIRFLAVNTQGQVVPAGQWSLDGQTLASSIKLKGDRAYIAYREAGLVVLGLADLSKPSLMGRFDGPTTAAEPALRDVRDVFPSSDPYNSYCLVSDGAKGLFQVYVY
ncbi:MAG: hypothetical protein KGN80_01590 [Acidobacteriota bacterium]|nr:hypothetical protein [Acidobacteriota bacterium]